MRTVALLCVLAASWLQPAALPRQHPTLDQILAKVASAASPPGKTKAKIVYQEADVTVGGVEQKSLTIRDTEHNRLYQRTGETESGFDGKKGWRRAPFFRGYLPDDDQFVLNQHRRHFALADYKESGAKYELLPDETINGRKQYVIKGEDTGPQGKPFPITFYLDAETYLLTKTIGGAALKQTTTYSDYRDIEGRKMAFDTVIETPQATITRQLTKILFDPKIDEKIFSYESAPPKEVLAASPEKPGGLPLEERRQTFERIWSTVNDSYFDPSFGGVDWSAVKKEYVPKVDAATSPEAFYAVLEEMVGRLGSSHFNILQPDQIRGPSSTRDQLEHGSAGIGVGWIENRPVIVSISPESDAAKQGLVAGDAIASIDGESVETLCESYFIGHPFSKKVAPDLHKSRAIGARLDGRPDSPVTLEVVDKKGGKKPVTVSRRLHDASGSQLAFSYKRIDSAVGYIAFNLWLGNLDQRFDEALKALAGCKSLIIDLRANSGGIGNLARAVSDRIFAGPGTLGTFKYRYSTESYSFKGKGSAAFTGPVVLIVDAGSASTSEVFAGGLQELKRAVVVGSQTAGAVLPSIMTGLPGGAYLQHPIADFTTPKGVRLEAHGVIPDISVPVTRESLYSGRDIVLDAAIAAAKR